MTRVVFMGTPQFAVPSLQALYDACYEITGVFTQPDRPAGRGKKLAICPVRQRALELGLETYQFERLRGEDGVRALKACAPDVVVTAAFGQILSQELLDIPAYGTVNVHASLLPRHRGSAPVNWAILQGDRDTGVTTMLTDAGIDTGAMLLSERVPIGPDETAGALTERLSHVGAALLIRTLETYLKGEVKPVPQSEADATYDPMLKKEMGLIDWKQSAEYIARQVRGLSPWPGTYTWCELGLVKVWGAREIDETCEAPAGTILCADARGGLRVACGKGVLELIEIQTPNSKRMQAAAWLVGHRLTVGSMMTNGEEPRV